MLLAPFGSTEAYRDAFTHGLMELLHEDQLGAYILVLANAIHDPNVHRLLKPQLETRFRELSVLLTGYLEEGRSLDDASDDLLVFLKLMALGFERLQMCQSRQVGPWQIQYNQLRSFRPARMSNHAVTELFTPLGEEDFHFNKPFLEKEILWSGDLQGRNCSLLYNKFPFAPLHGLLVLEPEQNRPQFLDHETHGYLWQLVERLGDDMPGVGFGYNSRGAYASVNHQHFQMYVRDAGRFPVEQQAWTHRGGSLGYPLVCHCLASRERAWELLHGLHEANCAYNLLYRPGLLYIIPRAMQGSYQHAGWTSGFAWAETAGAITTFRSSDYAQLDEQQIAAELKKLAIQ